MRNEMKRGVRYRIEYLPLGARTVTKIVVADVIDVRQDKYVISGRPEFGTADILKSQVVAFEETTDATHPPKRKRT